MEFRFRAKDERLFPSNPIHSSDIYLDQALQGRSMEELEKELLEEKIRGEIIAQRIMQKRMLEEEAKRNIELNHKMSKNTTDDQSNLLLNNLGADVAQKLSSPVIEEIKEMPMEIDTPVKDDLVCQKRKFSTTSEETREVKHQKIVTEWGCALCHFSAASEDAFKEHVKDQNHITNLSKFNSSRKATEHNNNENTLTEKAGKLKENKEIKAAKKTQEAKEKGPDGGEMNCTICGVSVTSKSALIEHEKGKKHLAKAAKVNPRNSGDDSNGKAIVNTPKSQVAPKKLKNGVVKEAVKAKDFHCTMCNVNCFSEGVLDSHLKGKKHLAMAQKMSLVPAINMTEKSSNEIKLPEKNEASDKTNTSPPSAQTHGVNLPKAENTDLSCILCDVRVTCKLALEEHQRGKKHLANVMKKSTT